MMHPGPSVPSNIGDDPARDRPTRAESDLIDRIAQILCKSDDGQWDRLDESIRIEYRVNACALIDAGLSFDPAPSVAETPEQPSERRWTLKICERCGHLMSPLLSRDPCEHLYLPVEVVPASYAEGLRRERDAAKKGRDNAAYQVGIFKPRADAAEARASRLEKALGRIVMWDEREKPHKNLPLLDCADLARSALAAAREATGQEDS